MKRRSALFLVACAACGQGSSPDPIATEPVWHLEIEMARVDGEVGPAAVRYLADADLGLSAEEDFEVLSVTIGATPRHLAAPGRSTAGYRFLGSENRRARRPTPPSSATRIVTRGLEGFEVVPAIRRRPRPGACPRAGVGGRSDAAPPRPPAGHRDP